MVSTVARHEGFRVRRGVLVALVVLALFLAAAWGIWMANGDLSVERRTVSVWVPKGAIMGDTTGVPATRVSLQDYQSRSQGFTNHVVTVMDSTNVIQYLESREGMLFRASITPLVQRPQGLAYWFINPSKSLDMAAGTVTYEYDPRFTIKAFTWTLIILGIIASFWVFFKTFPGNTDWNFWLSEYFPHKK